MVSCHGSHINKSKKFPSLLEFLKNQKSAIEYDSASLRTTNNNQHYRGTNEGVVSKETMVLRRWGSSIQKFGFINGVDNVNWPPYRDSKSGTSHCTEGVEEVNKEPKPKCLIHEHGRHWTADCRTYLAKLIEEKKTIIKDKRACWSCLKIGHRQRTCKSRKDCGVGGCTRKHYPSIHEREETRQQAYATIQTLTPA